MASKRRKPEVDSDSDTDECFSEACSDFPDSSEDEYESDEDDVTTSTYMQLADSSEDNDNFHETDDSDDEEWKKTKFDQNYVPDFDSLVVTPLATSHLTGKNKEIDFFTAFFDEEVMNVIVTETNRYAEQKKSKSWYPVTTNEMFAFIGMIIYMGLVPLPVKELYWSTNPLFYVEKIASVMPVNRFKKILSNLHLNDNEKMPGRDKPDFDKLYKLRPLIERLNKLFGSIAVQTDSQSVDECMVKFKGRSSMKQWMEKKPIKRGYKIWARCDSKTGYLYRFEVYTGKSEKLPEEGLGASVVLNLCNSLTGQLKHITFDNFFTSPYLMEELVFNGIYSTGTVRTNRKGLPSIADKKKK